MSTVTEGNTIGALSVADMSTVTEGNTIGALSVGDMSTVTEGNTLEMDWVCTCVNEIAVASSGGSSISLSVFALVVCKRVWIGRCSLVADGDTMME